MDWTEIGFVVAGALLPALLSGGSKKSSNGDVTIYGRPPLPDGTSCVRTARFSRSGGRCYDVTSNRVVDDTYCTAQAVAPATDSYFWPWSHPACGG